MKVYLAGPMSGIPEFNYPAFKKAARNLRTLGYEVVSPVELDDEAGLTGTDSPIGDVKQLSQTWGDLLARDVKLLADGGLDGIVLLDGWQSSKGARVEALVGILNGLRIFQFVPTVVYPILVPNAIVLMGIGGQSGL